MKKFVFLAILGFCLASCSKSSGNSAIEVPNSTTAATPAKVDDLPSAPQFDLPKISGGSMKLADLKGKVVVVDFWATWCVDCIKEIPNNNALSDKYKDKDVQFLAITLESGTVDDIKPKVAEFQMKYPALLGNDDVVKGFGGLIGYPTTFVLTRDGKIDHKYLGLTPNKKEKIDQEITNLLGQEVASK